MTETAKSNVELHNIDGSPI